MAFIKHNRQKSGNWVTLWQYPEDSGEVKIGQMYRRLHKSSKDVVEKFGDPTKSLEWIAAEQTPAREKRRLASMWYILQLVIRNNRPAADTWSRRLLGGAVPSNVIARMAYDIPESDRFRAISLWEHTLDSCAVNMNPQADDM